MALKKSTKHNALKPNELKSACNPDLFEFDTTKNVSAIHEIIGQEKALKSLKVGVELWSTGYNIFIAGLSGTGKATTVKKLLESIRPQCPILNDYAYVYNFENPDEPKLLIFPAGDAEKFKNDISDTIKYLQEKIPQSLENESYKDEKNRIVGEFNKDHHHLLERFKEKLNKENFSLGQVKEDGYSRPEVFYVFNDEPVVVQQLEEQVKEGKISKDEVLKITNKYARYQEELQSVFKKELELSQTYRVKLENLEKEAVSVLVKSSIDRLKEKYPIEKVVNHLTKVEENILDSLDYFTGIKPRSEETKEGIIIDYFKEYEVNVILDNSHTKECPIVIETTPSFTNLFGTIEKFSDGNGGWYADFTKIKAGSLLKANGGYLVLNAMDAFQEPGVWKTLKRVLMYGKVEIQDFSSYYFFSPTLLKPESIECTIKVIFIGSNYLYSLLAEYEDDFKKIFKIKADFDYEMPRNSKSEIEYARFIKKMIESEKLKDFDNSAISTVIEYGSRYAEHKGKLTTRFSFVADLVREANFWANDSGSEIVTDYHVKEAYDSGKERHSLFESKLQEMIQEGSILIDTEGARVGQVNGLAVYGSSYYWFGKPTRITATVSLGNGNIINVEREAGLSGNTHNKGVLIINGYFRETFGQNNPLAFTASLVFEQGYGLIDGDSATAAEICALLSTLACVPINQSFAITGSVNQKGDIQPIGGVNEKIEGFFDICKERGLTKKQGVIIPEQNVRNLMLREDVIEAVKNKEFHIYSVTRIEEAIEILTGVKAGKKLKSGHYEADTIYGNVEKRLKEMYSKLKPVTQIKNNAIAPKINQVNQTNKKGRKS